MFQITRGAQPRAQKIVLYGVEGIGKTTLAAQAPNPLFIDTEGGSSHLDVRRLPAPTSWQMLLDEVAWIRDFPAECAGTLVVDTADWAERLCIESILAEKNWKSIEDPGYGKGFTFVTERFGKLLNLLSEVAESGNNVVVTAHAVISKFEQPDEMGAYDRWGLKLIDGKKASDAAMLKEWADAVLFCNYRTVVVEDKNGKSKAQNGKDRVIFATHAAAWDAKNRWGLPDEVPMAWASIAPFVPVPAFAAAAPAPTAAEVEAGRQIPVPFDVSPDSPAEVDVGGDNLGITAPYAPEPVPPREPAWLSPLRDLMAQDGIDSSTLRAALAKKGYITSDTPFESFREDLAGWAVSAWGPIRDYIRAGMPDAE